MAGRLEMDMDALTIVLIVLAVLVVVALVFVLLRRTQRSGTTLAAPSKINTKEDGS